ncbi:MAG: two-component sensor histidine kinase [Rhizobacter sp.]|nr:two-component sensor histidine kinase [Rhizobacter sp.]
MNSLRRRLLVWLLPSTLLAGVLASAGTYWGSALELADLLDVQLRYVAQHVDFDGRHLNVDQTNVYRQRLVDDKADEVLVQAWRGEHLAYTNDASLGLPAPLEDGFVDVSFGGQVWHTYVVQRDDLRIRVAQARDERWEALARVALHLIWPIAALIPLLGVCLWYGIGRGLKPLKHIASELSTRDANSMAPVAPESLPSEVKPLVDALNQLLLRLDQAFGAQRAFIADAAHELRTPIMGISVQAGLAATAKVAHEREAALEQVGCGIARLGHLAQQLLTLARLEPGACSPEPAPFDLVDVCKSVILDHVHLAEFKRLDLGLGKQEKASIAGDAQHVRIMLNNLVDNAIRYTQAGGRIDVAVQHDRQEVVLEVRDDGPGIPEQERERVLDRFYRGKQQTQTGSGLGLSIVKRIADAHGAAICIGAGARGRGTCVQVRFMSLTHNAAGVRPMMVV